ncbi:formate dehydrogenase accessory sulfurtransferase FdhD [Desulfovibrio mangrovi]|uniref:formate dehydrogenase accessory sulfurtransferase FdhD n=1 Tax=Desulfovibrio mangrovi TaxID=2976983 RepID=UPI002245DBF6|nr:formate dehydrogenase accessory sulfurtransferase FdhD [Desulfovibrio mangrovi]UZP67745.1 formate dehydrogenase accessory sulfurtransferase FdhD [Desulfovibrio mangrovi]
MQTIKRTILRYREGGARTSDDTILTEATLEIVVNGVPWAALMCTPGSDEDLALGFCLTEGLMTPYETYGVEGRESMPDGSRLHLVISGGAERVHAALSGRGMRTGASCCGNRSATRAEDLIRIIPAVSDDYRISPGQLHQLQMESEACQALFDSTGATHFCALYDAENSMLAYAEDVGRHNALDKAAGQAFRLGRLQRARLVLLSSRLSFEMVQKSIALGAQVVAGFSAVTSRAVALAESSGVTLVGFLRSPRLNIYTHPVRLGYESPGVSLHHVDMSKYFPGLSS